METSNLQASLRDLNGRVQNGLSRIQSLRNEIIELHTQVKSWESKGHTYLQMIKIPQNEDRSTELASKAQECFDNAEKCRSDAMSKSMERTRLIQEAKSFIPYYQNLGAEAKKNVSSLNQTLEKLRPLASSKYGGEEINHTLMDVQGRLSENQKIAHQCASNIAYIEKL